MRDPTLDVSDEVLARISRHLTVEARNRPAITALRLLAVLNVSFPVGRRTRVATSFARARIRMARLHPQKYARIIQEMRRRASRALY